MFSVIRGLGPASVSTPKLSDVCDLSEHNWISSAWGKSQSYSNPPCAKQLLVTFLSSCFIFFCPIYNIVVQCPDKCPYNSNRWTVPVLCLLMLYSFIYHVFCQLRFYLLVCSEIKVSLCGWLEIIYSLRVLQVQFPCFFFFTHFPSGLQAHLTYLFGCWILS